jgi:peptide/nickel transport system ATP-binding protein
MATTSEPGTAVDIRGLDITFATDGGDVSAVRGADLAVRTGEVLAIVGESGSGKTVTGRSILGLLPETARVDGVVLLTGTDVVGLSGERMRALRGPAAAMIFQEPSTSLNPVYTVGWQLAEGLRAHGAVSKAEARATAIDVLRRVGIPDPERRVDDYPHQFSGGQKQRIVIAMALALRPAVIVADEPTTALDVTVQAEILDLLRTLRDEFGTAIVLITHNMGVVADLADRVAVMYRGEIVETAPAQQLFDHPRHPYTQRLLAAVPRLEIADRAYTGDAAASPIVVARDLEIVYPGRLGRKSFTAVSGVTFDIRPGEVLGLVGESGSGKTTIGRAIAGLTRVTGGSLQVLGVELVGARERDFRPRRSELGFVFQDPASSFNPLLTIADCIAEPLVVHGMAPNPRGSARQGRRTAGCRAAARRLRRPLPARAERRAASARIPRPGARARPEAADRRRADECARRLGAGAGTRAVRRASAALRLRLPVHHARPRRRRPARPPRRRAAPRADRRTGTDRPGAGFAAGSVHAASHRRPSGARSGRAGGPPRRALTT